MRASVAYCGSVRASAFKMRRTVTALIEKTGDPWLERIVTNHVAVIEMCLGNFQRAMELVTRSLELCRRYGDRTREGDGLSVAGIILLEVGQLDAAATTLGEALALLSHTASRWSRTDCLIYAGRSRTRWTMRRWGPRPHARPPCSATRSRGWRGRR